jgi:hypothetical protein
MCRFRHGYRLCRRDPRPCLAWFGFSERSSNVNKETYGMPFTAGISFHLGSVDTSMFLCSKRDTGLIQM